MQDFQTEDEGTTRTFTAGTREYKVQRTDPYHFWSFMGTVAEELRGSYTSLAQAERAANTFEATRPKPMERSILSTDGKGGKSRVKYEDVKKDKE